MPTLTITIELDNQAFQDGRLGREVHRILTRYTNERAAAVLPVQMIERFRDVNGNCVGHADVEED